jgi:hypothetical protein
VKHMNLVETYTVQVVRVRIRVAACHKYEK